MMGNIRLIPMGFETVDIVENERNGVLLEFLGMKEAAKEDNLYADVSLFTYPFSYGNFYDDFVYASWDKFRTKSSLKGFAQNTIQYLQSIWFQQPVIQTISNEVEWESKHEPRINAGLRKPILIPNYIYDSNTHSQWIHDWLTANPNMINWESAVNDVFPYPQKIHSFMQKLVEEQCNPSLWHKEQYAVLRPDGTWHLRDTEIVNAFHGEYLRHLDAAERKAVSERIGTHICELNHYQFEEEGSRIESQHNSGRKIFSIKKNGHKQYLSVDFVHGMFEFIDEYNVHQGEKRFDGSYNSDPTPETHGFQEFEKWKNLL